MQISRNPIERYGRTYHSVEKYAGTEDINSIIELGVYLDHNKGIAGSNGPACWLCPYNGPRGCFSEQCRSHEIFVLAEYVPILIMRGATYADN